MEIISGNIYLIGARATGKTTVGRVLAEKLAMEFVDVDKLIMMRDGRTIRDIVADGGWNIFREKEKAVLLEISHKNGQIVATGGGAILHQDIWPQIMASGIVVWLKADIATVQKRLLGDVLTKEQRPSLSGDDPVVEAMETMRVREPLYQGGSHVAIDTKQAIDDIVDITIIQVGKLWQEAHLAQSLK